MADRGRKSAARHKSRHDGYWETETIEPPKPERPTVCTIEDCDSKPKARGLCPRHYKASRRPKGMANEAGSRRPLQLVALMVATGSAASGH